MISGKAQLGLADYREQFYYVCFVFLLLERKLKEGSYVEGHSDGPDVDWLSFYGRKALLLVNDRRRILEGRNICYLQTYLFLQYCCSKR